MGRAHLGLVILAFAALAQASEPPTATQAEDPNSPPASAAPPPRASSIKLDKPVVEAPETPATEAVKEAESPADVEPQPAPTAPPDKAPPVELDKPVVTEPDPEHEVPPAAEPAPELSPEKAPDPQEPHADTAAEEPQEAPPPPALLILGTEVPRSTSTRLSWSPSQTLEGIATSTPVLVVNGAKPGPALCLTAAIHGDELNGIEIVRRVLYNLEPESLTGTVIGVPILNLQGFHRSSRYLADRRDLNRYFPGTPEGSSAARIAYSFFEEVIRHCDALVDLHTGSFHRTNMPQLRGDLRDPSVRALTEGFGNTVVLQSLGAAGTLRRAAVNAGIPAVTLEAGESMRLQNRAVEHGVNGITTLMNKLGMIERFKLWGDPEPVYHQSVWIRADQGGILFGEVKLGDNVRKGDVLGSVVDPITNISSEIVAPRDARVIGMALNQVVLPGYAAFHLAYATPKNEVGTLSGEQLDFIQPQGTFFGAAATSEPAAAEEEFLPEEDPDASTANGELPEAVDTDDFDE